MEQFFVPGTFYQLTKIEWVATRFDKAKMQGKQYRPKSAAAFQSPCDAVFDDGQCTIEKRGLWQLGSL